MGDGPAPPLSPFRSARGWPGPGVPFGPFFRYFGRMHNCFWPRATISRLGAQPCVAKSCKNVPRKVRDLHFTPRLWCAMGVGDLGGDNGSACGGVNPSGGAKDLLLAASALPRSPNSLLDGRHRLDLARLAPMTPFVPLQLGCAAPTRALGANGKGAAHRGLDSLPHRCQRARQMTSNFCGFARGAQKASSSYM